MRSVMAVTDNTRARSVKDSAAEASGGRNPMAARARIVLFIFLSLLWTGSCWLNASPCFPLTPVEDDRELLAQDFAHPNGPFGPERVRRCFVHVRDLRHLELDG